MKYTSVCQRKAQQDVKHVLNVHGYIAAERLL